MKITHTLKTSQQKQALFQPDEVNTSITSTSSRREDTELKGGAHKAERERFLMEQLFCPSKISTICSTQKIN